MRFWQLVFLYHRTLVIPACCSPLLFGSHFSCSRISLASLISYWLTLIIPHICVVLYNLWSIFTDIPHTVLSATLRKARQGLLPCVNIFFLKRQRRLVALLKITQFSKCQSQAARQTPNPTLFCGIESTCFRGDLISPKTFKIFSIPDFVSFWKPFWDFV